MYSAAATACIFRIGQREKIVKRSEEERRCSHYEIDDWGNTRIEFRLDYCSAENQEEREREYLKRMTRIASLAMSAIHKDAS